MAQPAKPWVVFGLVAIGVFMATLDSSIVNVSLPAIAHYFSVPLGAAVEWVVISYLVTVAALLLSIGRLSDLLGRKTIWMTGLTVFTLGSALCGAATSLPWLIAARALQGVGGASLMAISPAMLTAAFPPEQRGRAIGLNAVTVALGISAGPTLGGIITEHSSWRFIFLVNLPFGALGLLGTWKLMAAERSAARARFDPLGACLLGVSLACLTAGISLGQELGWGAGLPIALDVVASISALLFVLHERRHPQPVIDFSLFRNRVFASACLSLLLCFSASFGISLLLPFYFAQLRGFDTQQTGLLLTPLPLAIAVIAPFSGALADRIGTRGLAAAGLVILCCGLLLLSRLHAHNSKPDIVWRLIVAGVGQALFQSPNNSALMGSAPPGRQGLASGMLATGRVMGQSLSVAFAGAVFAALGGGSAGRALAAGAAGARLETLRGTFLHGFSAALQGLALIAACAALVALVRGRHVAAE